MTEHILCGLCNRVIWREDAIECGDLLVCIDHPEEVEKAQAEALDDEEETEGG